MQVMRKVRSAYAICMSALPGFARTRLICVFAHTHTSVEIPSWSLLQGHHPDFARKGASCRCTECDGVYSGQPYQTCIERAIFQRESARSHSFNFADMHMRRPKHHNCDWQTLWTCKHSLLVGNVSIDLRLSTHSQIPSRRRDPTSLKNKKVHVQMHLRLCVLDSNQKDEHFEAKRTCRNRIPPQFSTLACLPKFKFIVGDLGDVLRLVPCMHCREQHVHNTRFAHSLVSVIYFDCMDIVYVHNVYRI